MTARQSGERPRAFPDHPGERPRAFPDHPTSAKGDAEDPVDVALAGIRRATDGIEPPAGFSGQVMARAAVVRPASWWADLGMVGRRFVPCAALAAAAALALAWSAQTGLDETAPSALELAQSLP